MRHVQVDDWATGETVVIKLDPMKAPAETAKDLYKVARKQDRTGNAIMPIMQARAASEPSCTSLLRQRCFYVML